MATPANKNSVEYWQRVTTRWRVIALGALSVLAMVLVFAGTLLWAESAAKLRALTQLQAEKAAAQLRAEKEAAKAAARLLARNEAVERAFREAEALAGGNVEIFGGKDGHPGGAAVIRLWERLLRLDEVIRAESGKAEKK